MTWKNVQDKFGESMAAYCYNSWHAVFRGDSGVHSAVIGRFLEQYVLVLVQLMHEHTQEKINYNDLMMELLRRSYPPQQIVAGKPTKSRLIQLSNALRKNGICIDPTKAGHFED